MIECACDCVCVCVRKWEWVLDSWEVKGTKCIPLPEWLQTAPNCSHVQHTHTRTRTHTHTHTLYSFTDQICHCLFLQRFSTWHPAVSCPPDLSRFKQPIPTYSRAEWPAYWLADWLVHSTDWADWPSDWLTHCLTVWSQLMLCIWTYWVSFSLPQQEYRSQQKTEMMNI